MTPLAVRWLVVVAVAAPACVLDFSGLEGGSRNHGDALPGDGSPADGLSGDSVDPEACLTTGPAGVRLPAPLGFCIDSTEVTRAQYDLFVQVREGDTAGQPSGCDWNTSYLPTSAWPPGAGDLDLPVVAVDWCDAATYCAWAGKSLCGLIGGGSLSPSDRNDGAKASWYAACSRCGAQLFPYGDTYNPSACVGGSHVEPVVAGATASCQGGYDGLFDMSGNVEEWIDSCDGVSAGAAGASDSCLSIGGDYADDQTRLGCTSSMAQMEYRNLREDWRGFRCCSP